MCRKAYTLFILAGEKPDAVVLANSPEEAATLLGAELRGTREENVWEIVFPLGLFNPPQLGSETERLQDAMWHYLIPAREERSVRLLLNLGAETELRMFLQELPLVAAKPSLE